MIERLTEWRTVRGTRRIQKRIARRGFGTCFEGSTLERAW